MRLNFGGEAGRGVGVPIRRYGFTLPSTNGRVSTFSDDALMSVLQLHDDMNNLDRSKFQYGA
jgi:hypothetical protein